MTDRRIDWEDLSHLTALVTGASSGIGEAFARGLAARGADVVLVARDQARLEAVAATLPGRADGRPHARVITMDLARPNASSQLSTILDANGVSVDILVNNAGVTSFGPIATQSFEEQQRMVGLNVAAASDLVNLLLPGMVSRGRGAIINIASGGSFRPTANMAVYAATKAFILSLSEALWAELRHAAPSIRVLAVAPGPTRTAALVDAAPKHVATPESVVDAAFKALGGDQPSIITDRGTRMQARLFRLLTRRRVALLVERGTRTDGSTAGSVDS